MVKAGYKIFRNIYLFYNVYIVLTYLSFIIINIDKEIRGKRKHDTKIYKYFSPMPHVSVQVDKAIKAC